MRGFEVDSASLDATKHAANPLIRPQPLSTLHQENFLARPVVKDARSRLMMLLELAKGLVAAFPNAWNEFLFRRFWGDGAFSSKSYLVMDNYADVKVRDRLGSTGDLLQAIRPGDLVDDEITYGKLSPNAAAMLSALFLRHTGKPLRIATDMEVEQTLNATLICYGNSDSNLKTFDVEVSSGAPLCQFVFDDDGQRAFKMCEQLHSMETRDGAAHDKAILLRITNPHHPNHTYVVCAGLSEWGSLAAVYYLTRNWKALHKRFDRFWQRRDFCVVLDVQVGQFENATELASMVRLGPGLQG